ncbi:MAG: serine/threonine-protein kinase [Elusimicrobiota bacterium]
MRELLFATALVLGLASCSGRGAQKQAQAEVRAAIAEMRRTSALLASARADAAKAKEELGFAANQQRKEADETGKRWWADTVRQRQRSVRQAELAAVAALDQHMRSGRRYVEAERGYKGAHGRNYDAKSAGEWAEQLAEFEKRGGEESQETKSGEGSRFWFWAGVAVGVGLLVWMLMYHVFPRLSAAAGRALDARDAGPAIQVRNEKAEKVELPLLGGKYRLHQVIGRGGCGKVWEAYENANLRRVAIKQMAAIAGVESSKVRELYLKEAETLAGLRHPNIVSLVEVLILGEEAYLVFEFVSGKTLQELIAVKKKLPWAQVRSVFIAVAQALEHAHAKGLIHRDLKPANIMIGENNAVKVMDFGIARAIGDSVAKPQGGAADAVNSVLARTRTVVGTPGYMSPDAYEGLVWPGVDIFACGVCIYEALAGQVPFGYGPWDPAMALRYVGPSAYAPSLPRGVDALVARMLAPDRGKRIQTAQEMESLLQLCGVV